MQNVIEWLVWYSLPEDGITVGIALGPLVGSALGIVVGCEVGIVVGVSVGNWDGSLVGSRWHKLDLINFRQFW